jgi:acyl-CoA hydrolase
MQMNPEELNRPSVVPELGIDWARWIRAADRVVCAQMTGEPRALLADLALAAGRGTRPAAVFLGTPFSNEAAAMPSTVSLEVWGGMGAAAAMMRERSLTVYPVHYSRTPDLFARDGLAADVALVSLARHPGTGRLYLAPAHGHILEAARRARHVIAEINAQAPCVRGAEWPEDLVPVAVVEVSSPLAVAPEPRATAVDQAIATQVADCVPDGASLQVGIGAVATAIVAGLAGRRRMIIRSGLYTDALWSLIKGGAVEPRAAGEPLVVCSAVYGTRELYAEVHDRPAYRIAPPAVTHGTPALAALPRFTAINGALEVDLLGQVNAESVGGRYLGGIGGLNDFVRGALASPDGTAIVAIPSRRRAGKSEAAGIVAALSGPATIPAADADVFVSEHGVARLRGLSRAGRARALIGIAHPDDRAALGRAAQELGLD